MPSWAARQGELARIASRQLFFVGGAPRSGTTWLQQMLDSHPDVSCRGEGHFMNQLAVPLGKLMAERRQVLEGKNNTLFQHTGGYQLPGDDEADFLTATAILLALQQQSAGRSCRAIGEKTPENVFFFDRLKDMFPAAKFLAIARDPRDVLTSAWHFFRKSVPAEVQAAEKTEFIRNALPSLASGARAMLAFAERYPADYRLVTYEGLCRTPTAILANLFRFIGVSDSDDIVRDCLKRTSFTALTGGRAPGEAQNGAFFRKGIAGDWQSTLTPAMNEMVLQELGWMYPHFGWRP
jgi:LPS sulfotransferase NodH